MSTIGGKMQTKPLHLAIAAMAVASLLTACSGGATPTPADATSSSVATESAIASATSDPRVRPVDVVKHGLYNELTAAQKGEIDRLNAMSLEEFLKTSMDDQLKFAQFVYDNNIARTKYLMAANRLPEYDPLKSVPEPNAKNTALEATRIEQLQVETQFTLMPEGKPLDRLVAQKMTVLRATQQTNGFHVIVKAFSEAQGGLIHIQNDPLPEASEVHVDSNGNATMIVNAHVHGNLTQTTWVFRKFKDITGKDRGTWQAILSITPDDPRFITTLK